VIHSEDIGEGVRLSEVELRGHVVGIVVWHPLKDGTLCGGQVLFDILWIRRAFPEAHFWRVECEKPLTLSPDIRCFQHPKFQGCIIDGLWRAV
jgi:hypothetical protein